MKVLRKIILGLSLSAQVFAAPLEVRQSTFTTIDAAVNRLLSRVLSEVYTLNTALINPGMLNLPGMLTTVQNDISSITSNLGSASSIISSATDAVECTLSAGDIQILLTNLGMAQTLVASLQTALTTAASSLGAGDISSLGSIFEDLETAFNEFNYDLQSYAAGLLPCISTVAPTLLTPVETALQTVGDSVQGLVDDLGVGGALNGLITTIT